MEQAQELEQRYADPLAGARLAAAAGMPLVGVTSNTVPPEPFLAAGCFPVVLNPSFPHAGARIGDFPSNRFMEDVFETRTRAIFDAVVSGGEPKLRSLVIPRTSEQEHKLFLYLRELARTASASLPEIYLYNLLHTLSPESEQYGLTATQHLVHHAESIAERSLDEARLHDAILRTNRCRQHLRALHALRLSPANTIAGVTAMQWTGAFYFTHPEEYARQLEAVLQAQPGLPARAGKRLLIKGASLPRPLLHAAVEQHGVTVVAEDDWWGSRAATPDISLIGDPIAAIFRHSFTYALSPRIFPPALADEWFLATAQQVDAVLFYLPFEDDVYGWDYPRWRQLLHTRGIPHYLVANDPRKGLDARWHDELQNFLASL